MKTLVIQHAAVTQLESVGLPTETAQTVDTLDVVHETDSTRSALKWLNEEAAEGTYSIHNIVQENIKVKVETVRKSSLLGGVSTRARSGTSPKPAARKKGGQRSGTATATP